MLNDEQVAEKVWDIKVDTMERAMMDLIPASHEPGFQAQYAGIEVHDIGNIGGVLMGRCYGVYKDEKVGPDRIWTIHLETLREDIL